MHYLAHNLLINPFRSERAVHLAMVSIYSEPLGGNLSGLSVD